MELTSCLYAGSVFHQRLRPRRHQFRHGLFLFCLDLDELDAIHRLVRLAGIERPALYAFRLADHAACSADPGATGTDRGPTSTGRRAKASLLSWIASQGLSLPGDVRVLLLTHLRVLGYVFNPVSFYFCFDGQDRPVCAVAEVGNTFGEQKLYLLHPDDLDTGGRFQRKVPKHFYVSPFVPLDVMFDFRLRPPGEHLDIQIDDWQGDQKVLLSALTGERVPLSDRNLARLTLRYPLITARVITLIHWQALRLWWKRIPWHRKAAHPELQRNVVRSHSGTPLAEAKKPEEIATSIP